MASPKWITPAGNLGIVPCLEYYQFNLDAYDPSAGTLSFNKISGTLPPGIQVVTQGRLQGIPVNVAGPDTNQTYSFTIRATNTTSGNIADRTFNLTITNVAPPVIIPKDVDLGLFYDGSTVAIQLQAIEFIVEDTLTWTLSSGELPPGLSLSSSGLISGYIEPIPVVGPGSDPDWDDSPWDLLGWNFPVGASRKLFTFTIEVTDGAKTDASTYTMDIYPRSGLTTDTSLLTADNSRVNINTLPKHFPIILTEQQDLVAERQGGYYSFQIQAIDLDGDILEYSMPAVSTGAFDEHENDTIPYLNQVVNDSNVYIGLSNIASPNKPGLKAGDTIQVLYTSPFDNQTTWHSANVTNFTTIRLSGNTVVTGNVGDYITQAISSANATISNISSTFGTIELAGNLVLANVGAYITQGSANAIITSNAIYESSLTVRHIAGTFSTTGGNISVNGVPANAYPTSATYFIDVAAVYNDTNTFTLGTVASSGIVNIAGVSTGARPFAFVSVGVSINGEIDQDTAPAAVGYDEGKYDQGVLILPLTLLPEQNSVIDSTSGWITGYLPDLTDNETTYEFEINVYKRDYPTYRSSRIYTLTVLGDLNNTITWLTPANLGSIDNGAISDLSIKAISSKGKTLYYKLTPNAFKRLPQGLSLLSNGLISGRVSFQLFSLDQGLTTIDGGTTTFDDTYLFSVTAYTYDGSVSATRVFTIQVTERNVEPYENLYLKALLSVEQRSQYLDIVQNQTIFPIEQIYRVEDPWFGISADLRALFLAGINPSYLSDYANAVAQNHYNKRIVFGPVKTAVARSQAYDVAEIASGRVIGTFQDNIGFIPTNFSTGYLPANTIPTGTQLTEEHIKYEVVYVEILDENTVSNSSGSFGPQNVISLSDKIANPYYDSDGNPYTTAYPNAFSNMESSVVTQLGYANKGALPDWMTSVQRNGTVLGFKRAVVLAYTVPGAGESTAWRFSQQGFNLNALDFTVDRYQLENIYSENYDIGANAFVSGSETTFDRYPAMTTIFNDVGTVDYAISIPFENINNRLVTSINTLGGLDGITNFSDGQTIVFAQQEFSTAADLTTSYNQGWSNVQLLWDGDIWDNDQGTATLTDDQLWDQSGYVPGYNENLLDSRITNQRIGIWRININDENVVSLTFVKSLSFYDRLYVRSGYRYGRTHIFFDPVVKTGNRIPNYSIIPEQIDIDGTTFDGSGTRFISNRDQYTTPEAGDKYIKFAKTGVFT